MPLSSLPIIPPIPSLIPFSTPFSTTAPVAPAPAADLARLQRLRAGEFGGLRRLDLSCGLTEFPREIFALADSLEILNLSGNLLRRLPDDLHRLHKLRVLFCSDNCFTELPPVLGRCTALTMIGFKANQIDSVPAAALPPALRWLILTDNRIASLPEALGGCSALQKLMLSGNRLHHLPASLVALDKLELLRIAANRFTALPDWLFTLPRLAWLACAGNPMSDAHEATAQAAYPMPLINWSELQLDQQVGEGASGVIYLGRWQPVQSRPAGTPAIPVAIKLFKGAMTSDGLPHSEMAACSAAGTQPNLIGFKGRISGHPAGVDGLVMEPISAAFVNLAGPPSLDSCTRDVYAPDQRFSAAAALRLATDIAAAVAHLHARGILHGDLYAHNILWNPQALEAPAPVPALLGDFGAASFFATHADGAATTGAAANAPGLALQCIETRAFGCLLEELLERCAGVSVPPAERAAVDALTLLKQRCLHPEVLSRPVFANILEELKRMCV